MPQRRPRVLLVDDERDNLELMVRVLSGRVDCTCVSNGEEALAQIVAHHFDLCIADLRMPGMSGLELMTSLRDSHPTVGRILVSAYADTHVLTTAINEGAVFRFLAKPFSPSHLQMVVDDFLRTNSARSNDLVLLADDDTESLRSMAAALERSGVEIITATNGSEALALIEKGDPGAAVIDLEMPGMTGLEVVSEAKKLSANLPIIIASEQINHRLALDCMASGAFDFMQKPVKQEELLFRVKRAFSDRRRRTELLALKASQGAFTSQLVADSEAMRSVMENVRAISLCDETVLITGETGTGKEAIAREIHRLSQRSSENFLAVNCGALPETLLESELFGHERGAFTGAVSRRKGLFEMASGGTLFLDEVGEMTQATQVKLLRVLEQREFVRVGGNESVRVNVRVLAATNRDLEEMVKDKAFRADLFYRLFVLPLHLPPLRSRREDINALLRFALARAAPGRAMTFSARALAEAMQYAWPGNVRELLNRVARAVALTPGGQIESLDLPVTPAAALVPSAVPVGSDGWIDRPLKEFVASTVAAAESTYLKRLLQATNGSLSEAAKRAGVDRKSIYNKMKAYGLEKADFKVKSGVRAVAPEPQPSAVIPMPAAVSSQKL